RSAGPPSWYGTRSSPRRMSLKLKLLAIVLFVGVVPVMVSTATALSIHQSAYDRTVVESRRDAAERAAALVRQRCQAETASPALLSQQVVRWPELNDAERDGALWVVYRQVEDV